MTPLLDGPFREREATVSPDGRWLAYQSDQTAAFQIVVQSFPDVGTLRRTVSSAGGWWPVWSRDGDELFYLSEAGLMAVSVETDPTFDAARPERLFATDAYRTGPADVFRSYDVAPDGRFLMLKGRGAAAGAPHHVIVQNWYQELLERAPLP